MKNVIDDVFPTLGAIPEKVRKASIVEQTEYLINGETCVQTPAKCLHVSHQNGGQAFPSHVKDRILVRQLREDQIINAY